MIRFAYPSGADELRSIVMAGFERSCGLGSVQSYSYNELVENKFFCFDACSQTTIYVLVSPPEECVALLISALKTKKVKVIVFGVIPSSLAQFLDMKISPISDQVIKATACKPAPIHGFSESEGSIRYIKGLAQDELILPGRALRRYDYSDEWNNLGFGAITADGSIWSLAHLAKVLPKNALAYLMNDNEELSAYCALWDYSQASLLWFNRGVGPIDSYEWRLIEIFIAKYRFDEVPIWPVLLEIPYGHEGVVTMRLDCDEDVESARTLYYAYREWKIPFSLALHAPIILDSKNHQLPIEVIADGGAILSHSLTHAPNWGGSLIEALREGSESAAAINQSIDISPRYAVSPFHQTPLYARIGLALAGYQGCVGGIISSDPDFIMARGGKPPGSNSGFIGHTQQCMLHGDCLLENGDQLANYKRAFEQAFNTKTLFGYLDHPFSERYQYGWKNERDRVEAHHKLVLYMNQYSNRILYLNENEALDFIHHKTSIGFIEHSNSPTLQAAVKSQSMYSVAVEYGNTVCEITHNNQELKILGHV